MPLKNIECILIVIAHIFFTKQKYHKLVVLIHPTLQNITVNFAKTQNENAGVSTRLRLKVLSTCEYINQIKYDENHLHNWPN